MLLLTLDKSANSPKFSSQSNHRSACLLPQPPHPCVRSKTTKTVVVAAKNCRSRGIKNWCNFAINVSPKHSHINVLPKHSHINLLPKHSQRKHFHSYLQFVKSCWVENKQNFARIFNDPFVRNVVFVDLQKEGVKNFTKPFRKAGPFSFVAGLYHSSEALVAIGKNSAALDEALISASDGIREKEDGNATLSLNLILYFK